MKPAFLDLTADQLAGASFIAGRAVSMLADVPGLGKSAQCVHAFDMSGATRGLVLCPPILLKNWQREFERWSFTGPQCHLITHGRAVVPRDGVAICSYDIASNPAIQKQLAARGGDFLFLDEAHRLKSQTAKRTKAVLGAHGIARGFSQVVWLTGTPAPNNAGEFFTFLKSAGQWHGSGSAFVSEFCQTRSSIYGTKICGNKNSEGLRRLLSAVYLRRSEIIGLPDLVTTIEPVQGGASDMAALEVATSPEIRAEIEAAIAAGDWQFFDTPHIATIRRLTGVAKAQAAAARVVYELDDGEPAIVVFALHSATIATIAGAVEAAGHSLAVIQGATSKRARQDAIDEFQAGRVRVLVCQTAAASEGITLTAARRVIIAEPSWTPAGNDQAIARVWRRGQRHTVRATFLALDQSVDEQVLETLRRKKRLISEIV